MWGLSVQVWQSVVLWANVVALAGGILTGAALFVSAWVSKNIADVVQQDADRRIAEARTRGDEARAEAAKANERANVAAERAASLEKDAAQLRLDLERERAKTDARILTESQYNILQELRGKVTRVNISWERNTECAFFANQIIQALDAAGIEMRVYFAPAGMVWTGVLVTAPDIPG
jgi:hypothetical protein